jgi:hypothetical protein
MAAIEECKIETKPDLEEVKGLSMTQGALVEGMIVKEEAAAKTLPLAESQSK